MASDDETDRAIIVIATTSDDEAVLRAIAARLVDEKLAACCQISGPVESIYRWENKVEQAQEFVCRIKTVASNFNAVVSVIESMHTYDVPQIVGEPISHCSAGYRKWLLDQLKV